MAQILTDGNDSAIATENNVYGLGGNDIIYTEQEGPNIYGGEGNDFIANRGDGIGDLYGERGSDTIHGGTSADRLYGGGSTDLLVGGEFSYATAAADGTIVAFNNETSGSDTLYGDDSFDSLWGLDGNDVLYGGDGDDSNLYSVQAPTSSGTGFWSVAAGLYGGAGNDYLDGGRGNDYLDGGEGADVMYGGQGNDVYVVDDAADGVFEANSSGLDIVRTVLDKYILPLEVEGIELQGSANLTAYGRSTNDYIYGNSGNNILFGDAGDDIIDGGAGNDTYSGGAGADLLRDTGGGNDQFVMTGNWGNDTIQGFQAGTGVGDTIYFSTSIFANINAVVAAWADVNGNVVINAGNGNTLTILGVTTAQLAGNDFIFGA